MVNALRYLRQTARHRRKVGETNYEGPVHEPEPGRVIKVRKEAAEGRAPNALGVVTPNRTQLLVGPGDAVAVGDLIDGETVEGTEEVRDGRGRLVMRRVTL